MIDAGSCTECLEPRWPNTSMTNNTLANTAKEIVACIINRYRRVNVYVLYLFLFEAL